MSALWQERTLESQRPLKRMVCFTWILTQRLRRIYVDYCMTVMPAFIASVLAVLDVAWIDE